jgi:hypothetical protein
LTLPLFAQLTLIFSKYSSPVSPEQGIFLPHLETESQPPLHTFLKMSISTYFHAFGFSKQIVALAFLDEINGVGAN